MSRFQTSEDFGLGTKLWHLVNWATHRLRGKDYELGAVIFGRQIRFVITSRRELKRVSEVSFEGKFLGRILEHLKPGDVFFDVGANIGLVSVIVGSRSEMEQGRIVSFEPEPRNLAQLRRNLSVNGFGERAEGEGLALAGRTGTAGLHVRGPVGDGRHSLVVGRGATGVVEVSLTTMDDYCRQRGLRPDVVKIDVEGAEGEVLSGMGDLLAAGHPRELFMEIHNKGGADCMPDGALIDDFLSAHAYARVWEERRGSGRHRHYRRAVD